MYIGNILYTKINFHSNHIEEQNLLPAEIYHRLADGM